MDPYDRTYASTTDVFGAEPEDTLLRFVDQLDPAAPVLDIGAGQGRNTIAVARAGLQVHALDPSRVGLTALEHRAQGESLTVETILGSFEDHATPAGSYGGVLAFGLIPDLTWDAVRRLRERSVAWLAPGGLLFVTGFTTEDPALPRFRADWREIRPNSFADPSGRGAGPESPGERVRTYLEPDQLLELFAGLDVLLHREGLGPEHRHGDGPPERHGRFEGVFRRPGEAATGRPRGGSVRR
jgi:tellurite methyltransferase